MGRKDEYLRPYKEMGESPPYITIADEKGFLSTDIFDEFQKVDLATVTKEYLDGLVKKYGFVVFEVPSFSQVYQIVTANETNETMKKWTKIIGILTGVMLLATVVSMIFTIIVASK